MVVSSGESLECWDVETFLNDHHRLLLALEQRDVSLAKVIMGEHLRQVRELHFQLPNCDQ